MRIRATKFLLIGLTIGLLAGYGAQPTSAITGAQPADDRTAQQQAQTCDTVLKLALETMQSSCSGVGRNQACYGNNQVTATPATDQPLVFEKSGDKVAIQNIKSLITSPLDMAKGTWGLSLLKVQANLPETLPGQNVLFLVYGDTSIQNNSGDMRAFYFSTGLGATQCQNAPKDGILVRAPKHTEVTFNANGVDIKIASTVALRAERGKEMRVHLIEGTATISAFGQAQTIEPGQGVILPLGGPNGDEAAGPPSEPQNWVMNDPLLNMVNLSQSLTEPGQALTLTIKGCVDRLTPSTAFVRGYSVFLHNSTGRLLPNLRVGQCIDVEGQLVMLEGRPYLYPSRISRINWRGGQSQVVPGQPGR